jgi:hypothetical protein
MTRSRRVLLLTAAVCAVAASSAAGYSHISEQVGTQVLPQHWRTSSLPINLTVDGGPTNVLAEINAAMGTWNGVTTARTTWGTATLGAVDFDKNNFGSAWGDLTGDGQHEVVIDEDGSIIQSLGYAPASVNGAGIAGGVINAGQAEINDMYLLINGSRNDFDRPSTEVHELGHTLGLGHASAGFAIGKDGSLAPLFTEEVPTMHPFSIGTTDRRTLEADDRASLSELYPAPNGSFASTTGTITGTVTRCSGEPVLGANVRAVNAADAGIQLTQITGFDGKTDGSYTINGVPPGDYFIVVEPLGGDENYLLSLPIFTRVDTDFTAEFLDATENDCAQDTDPKAQDSIQVGATGTKIADLKVEGASLALVIDVTGSMGPELTAMKVGLDAMISGIEATGGSFPKTAIVTFDDASQLRTVSRDPDKLRDIINNLTTHSTADCPEGSNRALMTAGRQLGSGGVAVLVTDADSHRTGPRREAVEEFYRSKGARLNTMLSGSCPPEQNPPAARKRAASLAPLTGTTPDGAQPVLTLGVENAVRTFSEETLFTGGLFTFQPEIKTAAADANTRYANTLANLGISAVRPAVAGLNPSALPRGTTLEVELTGSNTGFRTGSTVAVAGGGVTATVVRVLSPTRLLVRLAVTPGAATGFRDVTVTTNRGDGSLESAKGIGAVQVVGAPAGPSILSVTPSVGAAGSTQDVTISGGLTHFAAGSVASFGAGVTVNHLTVTSPTRAVANVTVAGGAAIGFRDVTVHTGGETAGETVPGPFLVTAATPPVARLVRATPAAGARNSTVDVTLTGADTAFGSGSVASVSGTGVQVLSTTVHGATSAVARLRISSTAPLGFRDLRVTTGVQDATLLDGFEVTPAKARPIPCTDRTAPSAAFASTRARKRKLRLRGGATDAGCAASAVARVEVAISRKAGRKCRFVTRSGKLSRARACAKPVWLKATGTTRWSLNTKRRLPRGRYTLRVRARDLAGNVQARAAQRKLRLR